MAEEVLNPKLGEQMQTEVANIGFCTRWLAIIEVMDSDGDKRLVALRGPTAEMLPVWDFRGWLLELMQSPDLFEEERDG